MVENERYCLVDTAHLARRKEFASREQVNEMDFGKKRTKFVEENVGGREC